MISKCYHTRYDAFSLSLTWIGPRAMRYHNFNILPHTLPYIFSQFTMVLGYLQHITAKFKKCILIFFFKIMMAARGNTLQIAQNHANLRENICKALNYGLSMFAEFEKLPYSSVISISARFHKPFHLLLWNLLSI